MTKGHLAKHMESCDLEGCPICVPVVAAMPEDKRPPEHQQLCPLDLCDLRLDGTPKYERRKGERRKDTQPSITQGWRDRAMDAEERERTLSKRLDKVSLDYQACLIRAQELVQL